MAEMKARGLLAVLVDIAPADEEDVLRWYDEEHLIERANIAGFVNARRYVSLSGTPRYLALYDVRDTAVLHSDVYIEMLRKNPTEWTRSAVRKFVSPTRNEYELAGAWGEKPGELAPYIYMLRFDLPGADEPAVLKSADADYLPSLARLPDVNGVKRYVATEGNPKHMLLVELQSDDAPQGAAWKDLAGSEAGRRLWSNIIEPAENVGRLVNSVLSPV